jgi:hypothetical protein
MALKNQFRASLSVGGVTIGNQQWDAFTGGKHTLTETKYTPYDGILRTYAGKPETENVTLEAAYSPAVHGNIVKHIGDKEDLRGQEAEVIIYDEEPGGVWATNRAPYVGKIIDITPPDGDSNDASTVAKIQIVVSVGSSAS